MTRNFKPSSQKARIVKYLASGRYLTLQNCLKEIGCMALSQRCTELQRAGFPIRSEIIETPGGSHIAKYSWIFPEQVKMEL